VDPRDVIASRNDSNAVSIDEEMALLAETQIRYQALTQTLGTRLGTLRNVIRGGR
jgi:flagellar basal-body rod protein FlgB